MNRLETLIITGKLEVRFQQHEQLLNELANLQKFIEERDYARLAISFGRLTELINDSEIDVSNHMQSLYKFISEAEEHFQREQKFNKTEEEKLNMPLEDLDFSLHVYNCLKRVNIHTVKDLVAMTEIDFMKVKNLGKIGYEEVVLKFKQLGFKMKK